MDRESNLNASPLTPESPVEDGLYLINGAIYLQVQKDSGRFDCTLYDRETMRKVCHWQMDTLTFWERTPQDIRAGIRFTEFAGCGVNAVSVEAASPDMLQKLEAAQQDTALDEYPMPDPRFTVTEVARMGYPDGGLLPVSDETAKDLFRQGFAIYEVNGHGKVQGPMGPHDLPRSSIGAIYAVSRALWQNSRGFREAVAGRMDRQAERELAFRGHAGDCFAIYQLNRRDPETRYIRYEPLEALQEQGLRPQREHYELVYTAPLPEGTGLNALWTRFNTDHPPDYLHPSMSVSDVIAVKKNGTLTCYYADRYSYAVLDDFFQQPSRQTDRAAPPCKPSIKARLAAKPVPGDKPVEKSKDREVR